MLIQSIRIRNFRSFVDSGSIQLENINVFTGPNNSGKSSVLLALYLFQKGNSTTGEDIRAGATTALVDLSISNAENLRPLQTIGFWGPATLNCNLHSPDRRTLSVTLSFVSPGNNQNFSLFPEEDPGHLFVPYLAKRKASGYSEDVRQQNAKRISSSLQFLPARLSRITTPAHPNHEAYKAKCQEILGFFVASVPSQGGQQVGIYLPDGETISVSSMGEGVPNIVGLISELVTARGRVFLIEEPENDLHPQALKALLDLIIESSHHNQFFVSTHSNIVVRHLASAENSKLFNVQGKFGELPTTAFISEVEPTVEARLEALRDLGYSFSDFDLWDGWLILEESSAERIIRDYLIPWFAPRLSRVRTLSASGVDKVEPVFEDFNRLVRFTHLEEAYRNSAWVIVDGDERGMEVVARLKSSYGGWDENRFRTLKHPRFEDYYPANFKEATADAFSKSDRKERMAAKKELLNSVLAWANQDMARAKAAFSESAKEIIDILIQIEAALP